MAARNLKENGAWITQHGSGTKRKPPRVPRTPLCGTDPGGCSVPTHQVPQWWLGVGGDFCLHEGLEKPPPAPRGPRLPPAPGQTSSSRNPPAHGWRFSSSPWGWPQSAPRPRAFNLPVQHKQGLGRGTAGDTGTGGARWRQTPAVTTAEGCLQELPLGHHPPVPLRAARPHALPAGILSPESSN